jgi:tetratricopeptide (TPR) repeat protein
MRSICIFMFLFLFSLAGFAQKAERKHIRQGNSLYEEEKFTEAEIEYRKSLEVDRQSPEGIFNLGNSLFKQEKPKEAIEQYQQITGTEKDSMRLSAAWHNIGNSFMQAQDFGKAIEAYKQALIHNYKDDQTRYNLAMAQAMLKNSRNNHSRNNSNKKRSKSRNNKSSRNSRNRKDPSSKTSPISKNNSKNT